MTAHRPDLPAKGGSSDRSKAGGDGRRVTRREPRQRVLRRRGAGRVRHRKATLKRGGSRVVFVSSELLTERWSSDRPTVGRDGWRSTRLTTTRAQLLLDRANRERTGACGPVVGPASLLRAQPETAVSKVSRSAPAAHAVRCRILACDDQATHLDNQPGASSKVASLGR